MREDSIIFFYYYLFHNGVNQLIIACYSIYNEARWLKASIDSIIDYVDKFVFIDGRFYQENECHLKRTEKLPYSTDGTIKIIEEYQCSILDKFFVLQEIKGMPYSTEVVKRNEYFKYGHEGDWFFIIDGDEIAEGNVAAGMKLVRKTNTIAVQLMVVNIGADSKPIDRPTQPIRFFKWSEDIHYCRNHATVLGKNDRSISSPSVFCEEFLLLNRHD